MSDSFMQGNGDSAISVPFSDDEVEPKGAATAAPVEDEDDDDASGSPEEKITRKRKRQERINRLLHEGKQAAEEVKALKAEHSSLREEIAQLKGFVAASAQQPRNDNAAPDPWEKQLDAVYAKQNEAYKAAQAEIKAGTFDDERNRYYERIAREVEAEKVRIHTQRELAQSRAASRQEQARQIWEQKYPEVYGNPNAYQYAEATFKRRQALGEKVTNDLVDEVMTEALTTFKLGPKRAPSASDKARLTGMAASGGGGGGGRGEGITPTPEIRRMAVALYPDMPEGDAIKKWVNGPGKRLRAQKVL